MEKKVGGALQFSKDWFELGIVTPARLKELEAEYRSSDDKNPEHYRWRMFKQFVEASRPLDGRTAKALYELGEKDPDVSMGGSMMAEILRLDECPDDLIESATESGRKHLMKLAGARRSNARKSDGRNDT
jgi:hypothetical protein